MEIKTMEDQNATVTANKRRILWITRTAVFVALLVVMQVITASFGNTIVTGSVVNLLLVTSVMTCGISSGLCVAVISPVVAKLIGIGPLWELIPFIIAGNIVIILLWHFLGNRKTKNKYTAWLIAWPVAAAGKFLTLYVGIVLIAVPLLLGLPEPQASAVSALFSIPQLITALIGGGLAILVIPPLKKAIRAN